MNMDLKNKTLNELEVIAESLGEKKYIAGYIFTFIQTKNASQITDITPLSKAFREILTQQGYYISKLKTIKIFTDPDSTQKYLFELPDGYRIETVLLHDGKRKTLCVSTQAGCEMNCEFCATAKMEFKRNLSAAEITDQVDIVQNDTGRINNIVYMGMGEPLLNYQAVLKSVRILNHPKGKKIGIRHLTISTCGIANRIRKLAEEDIHPRLAVSLNAATDLTRSKIMPVNEKFPLAALVAALKEYQARTTQRITFEYVLIKGVNDSLLLARKLANLARQFKCNINLIEYNPHDGCKFAASSNQAINLFADILDEAGIETIIRYKKGQQIKAACGQLGANLLTGRTGSAE